MKTYKVEMIDMAFERSKIIEKANGVSEDTQIHFAKCILKPDDLNINHWRGEILGWCNYINKLLLKPNSRHLNKKEVLKWFLYDGIDDDDDYERILMEAINKEKWTDEWINGGLKYDPLKFKIKYKQFSEQISNMINNKTNENELKNYISTFNFK